MLDICLLVFATSCDSFLMSIAYGVEGIHLPRKAIFIISFCGTFILGISMFLASLFSSILPPTVGRYVSFVILFLLGITSLFQAQMKRYVKKHKDPFVIKFKGISFVIDIFLDEKKADMDQSKDLSMHEAFYLGVALSIDSLTSGIAYGIGFSDARLVLAISFLLGILLIYLGNYIGKHIATQNHHDFSWVCGSMLIILAFLRL